MRAQSRVLIYLIVLAILAAIIVNVLSSERYGRVAALITPSGISRALPYYRHVDECGGYTRYYCEDDCDCVRPVRRDVQPSPSHVCPGGVCPDVWRQILLWALIFGLVILAIWILINLPAGWTRGIPAPAPRVSVPPPDMPRAPLRSGPVIRLPGWRWLAPPLGLIRTTVHEPPTSGWAVLVVLAFLLMFVLLLRCWGLLGPP